MRLDRELTLHLFRPLNRSQDERLPILMYHSISDDPEAGLNPYYRVATSSGRFTEQMRWLAEMGYKGVSLEQALAAGGDVSNGVKLAAITFDDGFRDFHTAAWPVLQSLSFTATMYLPTGFIASHRKSYLRKECLTWDEVRELRRQGVRFGSHTVNHPTLYKSHWNEIAQEVAQSKNRIEQEIGESVSSFAYPFAFPQEDRNFTGRLAEVLQASGFSSGATTMIGRQSRAGNSFWLKRLPVNDCDDRELFSAKLKGAYDWLAGPQRMFRQARALAVKSSRRVS